MKNAFIIISFLFNIVIVFSQEKKALSLLKTDSTWTKEIIKFPIGFAQEIKYEGFEDLRFPQGWSKEDSPNFWSYVWAWSINDIREVTASELEKNIQFYFDGLLGLEFYKIEGKHLRKTNALFMKKSNSKYVGKVKTFDTRYTKKRMTLNVLVENYYCEQEKKTIIVFRFSPKPFVDNVWSKLDEVKLRVNYCSK